MSGGQVLEHLVPTVYLFHGDDELAIQRAVGELKAKSSQGGMGAMNLTELDGRAASLDELRNSALAMPFLADRRVVIVHNLLSRFTTRRKTEDEVDNGSIKLKSGGKKEREILLDLFDSVPTTTALVLVENQLLDDTQIGRKAKKDHWLVHWVKTHPDDTFYRVYQLPRGPAMASWIQSRAKEMGGSIARDAANELSNLVGSDTRTAENELQKLLLYANFKREVQYDDVALLVADIAEADIFAMVDAIGVRDGKTASKLLNRLLDEREPPLIFGMVIRQFRLLLMANDVIERGGNEAQIAREAKIHPFVAKKLNEQARRFRTPDLEAIYLRLLVIDREVKSSQIDLPVALNMLVAATAQ